jgi:hypothetical protein
VVAEVKLTRVLIDGGSGLNVIFASTLKKMGLDLTNKRVPSKAPFYSIVPGNAAHPLGTVILPVTFGMRENYRTEFIKFEVALKSSWTSRRRRQANQALSRQARWLSSRAGHLDEEGEPIRR